MENIGIYVHIPFCMRKCYYCDFCSYPGKLEKQEDYVQALKEEIKKQKSKKLCRYNIYRWWNTINYRCVIYSRNFKLYKG